MNFIKISVIAITVHFISMLNVDNLFSQINRELIEKIAIGESQIRYYIHYDLRGNNYNKNVFGEISQNIKSRDEIVIRFYPTQYFDLSRIDIPELDTIQAFFLFPSAKPDTFSIHRGTGTIYFATKAKGRFHIRIEKSTTNKNIGDEFQLKEISKEFQNYEARKVAKLNEIFAQQNFPDDWEIWKFENVSFTDGYYTLELFLISGQIASLICRLETLHIGEVYKNVVLLHNQELSASLHIKMEEKPEMGYYEAFLSSDKTTAGVHYLNIMYDYSTDSWYFKQAPTAANGKRLKYDPDKIIIGKEQELPNSLRIRAGFAAFDHAREARLISNFVLVLSPKEYFSRSTDFINRFNPTIGLQIGGTGNQDIVFLLGLSFKLINEGDFILGLRFGAEQQNEKWNSGKNLYFGASLDPGLFGKIKNIK